MQSSSNENNTIKRFLSGAAFAILLLMIDQATKLLAVAKLKDQSPFVLLDGVFELHYLENQGAAFGILQGKKVFFVLLTIIMVVLLIYIYARLPQVKRFFPLQVLCILLFSGAIGNFIDRLAHNYVIDFFYFSLIDFPIFNVADIYVTVAVFFLILLFLFYYKDEDLDFLIAAVFHRTNKDIK